MSHHDPEKLWSLWQREQLDGEMATGQVLQNLIKYDKALAATNVTVYQLRDKVETQQADLTALRTDVAQLQAVVDRLTALIESQFSTSLEQNAPRSR